jgi:hypothetical protein
MFIFAVATDTTISYSLGRQHGLMSSLANPMAVNKVKRRKILNSKSNQGKMWHEWFNISVTKVVNIICKIIRI